MNYEKDNVSNMDIGVITPTDSITALLMEGCDRHLASSRFILGKGR